MRTPKAGEEWVCLPCEKHRFKQLRDLVVIGVDHEDQPGFIQEMELEHIRCGCQYPADDPAQALLDLRRDEARHEGELRAKYAALMAPQSADPSLGYDGPKLILMILAAMAVLMWFVLTR